MSRDEHGFDENYLLEGERRVCLGELVSEPQQQGRADYDCQAKPEVSDDMHELLTPPKAACDLSALESTPTNAEELGH